MASQHATKQASWIAVGLLIVACVLLAFAFVLQSIPLAVLGAVVGVAGMVLAKVFNIMEDAH